MPFCRSSERAQSAYRWFKSAYISFLKDRQRHSMNYRTEIDGLRAVAVLPVLMFHAGVPFFAGGYVGVDVFFVISGYLITGIIALEMAEGRFSLIAFYERRIRRIIPCLMAVIGFCLVAAAILFLPGDFMNL